MAIVLERLSLAAVNNRVFSINDETQVLLQRFNQVFKDLIMVSLRRTMTLRHFSRTATDSCKRHLTGCQPFCSN